MFAIVLSFCFVINATDEPRSVEVPEVLKRAHLARADYKTAYFRFKMTREWPGYARRVENIEARFVGDSVYLINSGDDDGIRLRDPKTGEPPLGVSYTCQSNKTVVNRETGETWRLQGSASAMGHRDRDYPKPDYVDVRTVGLSSHAIQRKTPREMLDVIGSGKTKIDCFRVKKKPNGTQIVTLVSETLESREVQGHLEYEWEICPDMGFAITHVKRTFVHPDGSREMVSEAFSQYTEADGHWWPRKTECTTNAGVACTVEYEHIEFDRPDHPTELGPEIMGVPIGCPVSSSRETNDGGYYHYYLGDGVMVDKEEWKQIKDTLDLAPLHAFWNRQASLGRGAFPKWWDDAYGGLDPKRIAYEPDDWETYVRRWIMKRTPTEYYSVEKPLDEKQTRAAYAILKDCRKRAEPITLRVKKELSALEGKIRLIKTAIAARDKSAGNKSDPNQARLTAARKRKAELERPKELEAIFSLLKKRLHELLTAPQRVEPVGGEKITEPPPLPPRAGKH